MNQLLVTIALMLDALLAGMTPAFIEPTKDTLYAASSQLAPAYVDMGFDSLAPSWTFENIGSARGAASVPYWQANPYCGRDLAIGMQYRYPAYRFYGTIDMLVTAAHEQAHMYQGVSCGAKTVETDATLLSLVAMQNTEGYEEAVLWQLRELAILRALAVDCDRSWMGDLSEQAQELYGDMSCGDARDRKLYTDALVVILEDTDGIVDPPAAPELDLTGLQEILQP